MRTESQHAEQCPICHECVRSEGPIHANCELCGMGVNSQSGTPYCLKENGEDAYFCCQRCSVIYRTEVSDNRSLVDFLKILNTEELIAEEDRIMRSIIIAYINEKYPLEGMTTRC